MTRVAYAVALIAFALSACSFHETRTVQPAPAAAVVVPADPAPSTAVVVTNP